MRMPGTRLRFDRNEIQLDSAVLHLGRSDLRLTGNVTNLAKSFFKKEELKAQLLVTSDRIDCNQLMRAMEKRNGLYGEGESRFPGYDFYRIGRYG